MCDVARPTRPRDDRQCRTDERRALAPRLPPYCLGGAQSTAERTPLARFAEESANVDLSRRRTYFGKITTNSSGSLPALPRDHKRPASTLLRQPTLPFPLPPTLVAVRYESYLVNVTRCCRFEHDETNSKGGVALVTNANSPSRLPVIDVRPTLAVICPQIARN